jgi:hypothetical protein
MAYDSSTSEVVRLLSDQIATAMQRSTQVGWNPTHDPDADDRRIKRQSERAAKLRIMRADYEQLMYGEIDD